MLLVAIQSPMPSGDAQSVEPLRQRKNLSFGLSAGREGAKPRSAV
jgi:hypothetical protein